MFQALVEFLQFVAHAAMLSHSMNKTLYYYDGETYTSVESAASIVYSLTYGMGTDISAMSCV